MDLAKLIAARILKAPSTMANVPAPIIEAAVQRTLEEVDGILYDLGEDEGPNFVGDWVSCESCDALAPYDQVPDDWAHDVEDDVYLCNSCKELGEAAAAAGATSAETTDTDTTQ